jgi:hypothetical protein
MVLHHFPAPASPDACVQSPQQTGLGCLTSFQRETDLKENV